MGISTGWRDVYERTLPFQYIDVSNLQPGHYWLRSQVDPNNLLRESNEVNAAVFASARSTVPGYIARAIGTVNPFQVSGVKHVDVQDHAVPGPVPQHRRGHPGLLGTPQYKITEQPEHGTLVTGTPDARDGSPAHGRVQEGRCLQRAGRLQVRGQPGHQPVPAQPGQRSRDASGRQRQRRHGRRHQRHARLGLHRPGRAAERGDHARRRLEAGLGRGRRARRQRHRRHDRRERVLQGARRRFPPTARCGSPPRRPTVRSTRSRSPIRARPAPPATPDLPDPPVPPSNPTNPTTPLKPLSKPVIARNGRRLVVKYMPGKTGKLSVTVKRKGKKLATCKVGVVQGSRRHLPVHAQEVEGEEAHRQPDGLRQAHGQGQDRGHATHHGVAEGQGQQHSNRTPLHPHADQALRVPRAPVE